MDSNNDDLVITSEKGVLTLRVNRPKKKNAMTSQMLKGIVQAMEKVKADDSIKVIFLTGTGDLFSSGNDFNNFVDNTFDEMITNFEGFIKYLIEYPKVMVAGVNGMCVGMSFTFLPIFDIVLCADNAMFIAPFIQTLQCPEACSSLTFPIMLGKSMAGHVLINGGEMTAEEAKNLGFVAKVFESSSFKENAYEYVTKLAKYPAKNLMLIKRMINRNFRKDLQEVNREECKDLRSTWDNQEFKDIMKKFVKNAKF
jgi:peroxisomal 3,2-trans-enoyl-CoA isomerase